MDVGFYSKDLFECARGYDVSTITNVLGESVKDGKAVEGVLYKANWFHFVTPKDLEVSIKFQSYPWTPMGKRNHICLGLTNWGFLF